MDDLISRAAAIDTIMSVNRTDNLKSVAMLIMDLPSAQPKPDKNPHPEQPDSDRLGVKTWETCSDTISRQNVLRCLTDISYNHCKTQGEADVIDTAKTMVVVMSSAQPEIIRCKDCKYHRQNDYGDSWCSHPKGLDGYELKPTDFCSRAKRKE